MNELVSTTSNHNPKLKSNSFKKTWNEYQHLPTQGRYIEPKIFAGFQDPRIKLTKVKQLLSTPKIPTPRRTERDDIVWRLPNDHSRQTTSFSEAQYQNMDPSNEDSYLEFSGLNWPNTSSTLPDINNSSYVRQDVPLEVRAKLRPDKLQKESRSSPTKVYRTPSLILMSSSATLTKPVKYSYKNNNSGQNSRTQFHLGAKTPRPTGNIFRSSSMYLAESSTLSKPIVNIDASKSSRV